MKKVIGIVILLAVGMAFAENTNKAANARIGYLSNPMREIEEQSNKIKELRDQAEKEKNPEKKKALLEKKDAEHAAYLKLMEQLTKEQFSKPKEK
jgi:hypothetical protein